MYSWMFLLLRCWHLNHVFMDVSFAVFLSVISCLHEWHYHGNYTTSDMLFALLIHVSSIYMSVYYFLPCWCNGCLYRIHSRFRLDVCSLWMLLIQECKGVCDVFLWWNDEGHHRCAISDNKKHGVNKILGNNLLNLCFQ